MFDEALMLVSAWCAGNVDDRSKWMCQDKLFDCLVLEGTALDRKNIIACFKNTR